MYAIYKIYHTVYITFRISFIPPLLLGNIYHCQSDAMYVPTRSTTVYFLHLHNVITITTTGRLLHKSLSPQKSNIVDSLTIQYCSTVLRP